MTVVEDRPIMSVNHCLPVLLLAKTITHPAARSLCDSWASCFVLSSSVYQPPCKWKIVFTQISYISECEAGRFSSHFCEMPVRSTVISLAYSTAPDTTKQSCSDVPDRSHPDLTDLLEMDLLWICDCFLFVAVLPLSWATLDQWLAICRQ